MIHTVHTMPASVLKGTERQIIEQTRILPIVSRLRKKGAKIVMTQGSYDLVHIGHARYLAAAKRHGDVLIVGIDSDKKIRKRKGPERPIVPQKERMEMVLHLRPVDIVVLKRLKDPKWNLIKLIRPDVLIATKDTYNDKELQQLKKICGDIIVLKRMATTTTSAKIRLLQIKTTKKLERVLTPKLVRALQEALAGV